MSPRVIYTPCNTYPNNPLIVQKEILDVLYIAQNLLINKPMVLFYGQTAHQLKKIHETWGFFSKKRGNNKHT